MVTTIPNDPQKRYRDGLGLFLLFILILNLHFSNYYVPSCVYAREPIFNHLDLTSLELTSLELTSPRILALTIAIASIFVGRKERGKVQHPSARFDPQNSHPSNPPPPRTQLLLSDICTKTTTEIKGKSESNGINLG